MEKRWRQIGSDFLVGGSGKSRGAGQYGSPWPERGGSNPPALSQAARGFSRRDALGYLRDGGAATAGGALDHVPGLFGGDHSGDGVVTLSVLWPALVHALRLRLRLTLR